MPLPVRQGAPWERASWHSRRAQSCTGRRQAGARAGQSELGRRFRNAHNPGVRRPEREASPRPGPAPPTSAAGKRGGGPRRRKVGITGWFLGGVLLGLLAALIAEPGPAAEPVGYVRKSAPSPSGTVLARSTAVLQGDPSERDATAPEGAPQSLESLAPTPSAPDLPAAAWDAGPALAEAGPGPAQASGNAPWSHPDPDSTSACPAGMLLVQGDWCPYLTERCVDWIDQKRDRCRRYAKPTVCHGRRDLTSASASIATNIRTKRACCRP